MAIDHRLLDDDGRIDLELWESRWRIGSSVGRCGSCQGQLRAGGTEPFDTVSGRRQLLIECVGCGHESWSIEGKLAHNTLARRAAAAVAGLPV